MVQHPMVTRWTPPRGGVLSFRPFRWQASRPAVDHPGRPGVVIRALTASLAYRGWVTTSPGPTPRSPLALAALATVALPGLDVVATRLPQHGDADFDVTGVLDGDGRTWVVRCPRHQAAGAALEGEVALLQVLAAAGDDGDLPFETPRPAGFAPLPEGGRAMVYRSLSGRPAPLAELASGSSLTMSIAAAIAALHRLETEIVADAGLPIYDAEGYRKLRLSELDSAAQTGLVPTVLLKRWEEALENIAVWRFLPVVTHGDLASEHVLVTDGEVVAMLDFTDARVADPADDLAWIVAEAPEESIEFFLDVYSRERGVTDEHLVLRAQLAGELALARWLLHGVRQEDRAVVDDAHQMLEELATLVASGGALPLIPVAADPAPSFVLRTDHEGAADSGPDAAQIAGLEVGVAGDDSADHEPDDNDSDNNPDADEDTSQRTQEIPNAADVARWQTTPQGESGDPRD